MNRGCFRRFTETDLDKTEGSFTFRGMVKENIALDDNGKVRCTPSSFVELPPEVIRDD